MFAYLIRGRWAGFFEEFVSVDGLVTSTRTSWSWTGADCASIGAITVTFSLSVVESMIFSRLMTRACQTLFACMSERRTGWTVSGNGCGLVACMWMCIS
jgi:hypothetical protein